MPSATGISSTGPAPFFDTDAFRTACDSAILILARSEKIDPPGGKSKLTSSVLQIIRTNPKEFDAGCQINVEFIGSNLMSLLQTIENPENLDDLISMLYRFVAELDLSMANDLSPELRQFCQHVKSEQKNFSGRAPDHIAWVRDGMSQAILKRVLNDPKIGNLQQTGRLSAEIDIKVEDWGKRLKAQEDRAAKLESSLKSYENAFIFVGLHQGFADLY